MTSAELAPLGVARRTKHGIAVSCNEKKLLVRYLGMFIPPTLSDSEQHQQQRLPALALKATQS